MTHVPYASNLKPKTHPAQCCEHCSGHHSSTCHSSTCASAQVRRGQGRGQRADDVDSYLALFEHKRQPNGRLLAPEVAAISAFLVMTVKEFALFQHADTVLKASRAATEDRLALTWPL